MKFSIKNFFSKCDQILYIFPYSVWLREKNNPEYGHFFRSDTRAYQGFTLC